MEKEELKHINLEKLTHATIFYSDDIENVRESIDDFIRTKLLENVKIFEEYKVIDAKEKGVSDIRDFFSDVEKKPIYSNKKVYYIQNADFLSTISQNTILKTLEEPQNGVYIFLDMRHLSNILDTIKSRCFKVYIESKNENIKFQNLDVKKFESFLNDLELKKTAFYLKYFPEITKENIDELLIYIEILLKQDINKIKKHPQIIEVITKVREMKNLNINIDILRDYLIFALLT